VSCYDGDLMNKIVEVQGFSMYWDVNAPLISMCSQAEIEVALFCLLSFCARNTCRKSHCSFWVLLVFWIWYTFEVPPYEITICICSVTKHWHIVSVGVSFAICWKFIIRKTRRKGKFIYCLMGQISDGAVIYKINVLVSFIFNFLQKGFYYEGDFTN